MATESRGKKRLHKILEEFGAMLEIQHAYERVMMSPRDFGVITGVETELRKLGMLSGVAFYADAQAKNEMGDFIKDRIAETAFRIDGQEARSIDLESIIFGKSMHIIGDRTGGRPDKTTGPRGAYMGQKLQDGSQDFTTGDFWYFRAKLPGGGGIPSRPGKIGSIYGRGDSNDIVGYLRTPALYAGDPGEGDLEQLRWIYVDHLSPGKDLHRAMALTSGGGISQQSIWQELNNGDSMSTSEGYTYYLAQALWAVISLATIYGYYDPGVIEYKAEKMAKDLIKALGIEALQVEKEIERNPIKQAIQRPPIPPPAPVKNLTPFDFQCFLIENIIELSSLHSKQKYKNVIKVNTYNNPGTAISRINHGGQSDQIKALMSMCPEAYALLVPSIKIYRVDYNKEKPTVPIGQQELHIPNYMDVEDIENIYSSGGGRYKGYGLKSFKWELAGVQPAEVDNNITANMTFYFQTIQDLFQGQRAAGQKEASPLDLIISSRASEIVRSAQTDDDIGDKPKGCKTLRNTMSENYDGASFRIKATVGWNAPPGFATAFPNFSEIVPGTKKTRGALLAEAIENTQISLFLQQTRHMLNFQENGTIELDISYQAALSGLLTEEKANILATDKKFFDQEIKSYEAKVSAEQKKGATGNKEKIEEMLEEITQLRTQDRMFKYKKFLKKVYESDKVWNIAVNPAELLITPWKDLTPKQRASRAKRRMSTEGLDAAGIGPRGFSVGSASDPKKFDTTLLQAVEEASKQPDKAEDELKKHTENTKNRFTNIPLSEDVVMIPYFYLGDLLDTVLETLPGYDDGEKFQFFLSEVEMLDPLLAFQIKNIAEVLCTDKIADAAFIDALRKSDPLRFSRINKIQHIINIGDIPISLDAFTVWFKDNVIKKDRDSYYFLYFVKDICAQLISNALRGDCFGNDVKFDIRFDAAKFDIRKGIKPGAISEVGQLAWHKANVKKNTHPKSVIPALFIYSTDSKPKRRKGNFEKDLADGIYHHYVGSACSIVKRINFQREDQPYLREAKIQKAGALGAAQLRELYSVNLDLIGNTLYKNGQYIYVDPTFVSGDASLARMLGISGYYLITSVSHVIAENGYDVSIRALQEGIDFDDNYGPVNVQLLAASGEDPPIYIAPPTPMASDDIEMASGDTIDAITDAITPTSISEGRDAILSESTDIMLNPNNTWTERLKAAATLGNALNPITGYPMGAARSAAENLALQNSAEDKLEETMTVDTESAE